MVHSKQDISKMVRGREGWIQPIFSLHTHLNFCEESQKSNHRNLKFSALKIVNKRAHDSSHRNDPSNFSYKNQIKN